MWQPKKNIFTSRNLVPAVAVIIVIGVAIVQLELGSFQRWHAVSWTLAPFFAVFSTYRRYWPSWQFWTSLTICMGLHLALMWRVWARLLANVDWLVREHGISFALEELEGVLLLIAVGVVMRRLAISTRASVYQYPET